MNVLEQLTAQQKQTVVALPFRVGLYVSKADDTGGEEADQQEAAALESIIQGFAENMLGSESIQYIMTATLENKKNWPQWSGDLKQVPRECRETVDALSVIVDEKDAKAFANHLLQIGEAVALAFREYEHLESKQKAYLLYFEYAKLYVHSLLKKLTPKSLDEFLSVSQKERAALTVLARALKTTY